jgi:hypothetical protein
VYDTSSRSQTSYIAGTPKPLSGAEFNPHGRPDLAQPPHQIFQVVVGSQRRMRRAVQQADHHHLVVLGGGDRPRQILVLLVIAVKKG